MRISIITAVAVTALLVAPGARADVAEQLRAGKILTTSAVVVDGVKPARGMALIDAPPDVVHKIITQVQYYREFVPSMVGSRHLKSNHYALQSDLPWPAKDSWVHVKMRSGQRGKTRIADWTMERGNFKEFKGTAWIQPYGKGRSVLTYQLLAVPKVLAPEALLNRGMKVVVKGVVEAIRERAVGIKTGAIVPGRRVANK